MVSNTMVCEVSRLLQPTALEGPHSWMGRRRKDVQVSDLLSLTEAIVLHDTLYTLPGRLDGDSDQLVLRNALIAEGILIELDTRAAHRPIAEMVVTGLKAIRDPVAVAGSAATIGKPIEFSSKMQQDIEEFLLILDADELKRRTQERNQTAQQYGGRAHMPPLLDDSNDYFGEGGGSAQPLAARDWEECGRSLIGWIHYHGSGAYEHCTSILRDMYYIFASEHFQLPYWPDITRTEFSRRFPNFFDKASYVQIYKRLAEGFQTTITDVYDDQAAAVAYIPPFAALALERSQTAEELLIRILELRQEYSKLRQSLAELEGERREAQSINDRLKYRRHQRALLNEIASAFDRPSRISLEGIIRYVPNVLNPVLKPGDPTKYSADLFMLPLKALLAWWTRRPIAMLFDLADKLQEIKRYEELASKVFGEDLELRWAWS